jgi:hypothetical protein
MKEDFEQGFAKLLEYDSYSVREYLQRVMLAHRFSTLLLT